MRNIALRRAEVPDGAEVADYRGVDINSFQARPCRVTSSTRKTTGDNDQRNLDCLLHFGEFDSLALKGVVELLVQVKKAGVPWTMRQPVSMPSAFIIRVSGVRISVTPPP